MNGRGNGDLVFAALIDPLGRAGRPGRQLGARIDLVRATGLRHAARRMRDAEKLGQLGRARRALYERIWRDAASAVGAEVVDLTHGFFELRKGRARTRVWEQWVELDDAVTLRLAFDKVVVHRLLRAAGVRVPDHLEVHFRDLAPALEFIADGGAAYVVKPASGTGGGVGLTCGVRRPADLRRAALRAARSDTRLLVERQADGIVYRLLFLDGELLDVVRRLPPRVTGDGRSTIDELIAAENDRRLLAGGDAGLELLTVDLDCVFTLEHAGLALSSVPPAGTEVAVKTVTNQSGADDNETVRERPAPELVDEALAAVDAVGLRLAGVDVITSDPSRPLADTGGAVIEVNGTPGLHHHYQVADREKAVRVAVPVLRKLLT